MYRKVKQKGGQRNWRDQREKAQKLRIGSQVANNQLEETEMVYYVEIRALALRDDFGFACANRRIK